MNIKSGIPHTENNPNVVAGILRRIGAVAIFLILMAVILLLAAGRIDWTWAWVYLWINIVTILIIGPIMMLTNPETIAERGEIRMTNKWDKIVSGFYLLAMYITLPLVAGLNIRFGWARDLSIAWHIAGAVVFEVGMGFAIWALMANAYFSTAVRIQSNRGHTVCSTGPYRLIRHPGYFGFILQALGVPIMLGSLWALIPGIIAAVFIIIRTSFEDRMLQDELPGYKDYIQKVRYRLVPPIW